MMYGRQKNNKIYAYFYESDFSFTSSSQIIISSKQQTVKTILLSSKPWLNIGPNKCQLQLIGKLVASRNVIRKASQMLDKASHDQRNASAAFNFGEDFSRQSIQAIDNYDNFHRTIMNLEPSQIEDSVRQIPQATNHYGASTEETRSQCFTPLTCN